MIVRLLGVVMVIIAFVVGKEWLWPMWVYKMAKEFNLFESTSLMLIAMSLLILAEGLFGLKMVFHRKK